MQFESAIGSSLIQFDKHGKSVRTASTRCSDAAGCATRNGQPARDGEPLGNGQCSRYPRSTWGFRTLNGDGSVDEPRRARDSRCTRISRVARNDGEHGVSSSRNGREFE